MMFRTADAKILNIYDISNASKFSERYATVLAEKESTAERKVVAIEPHFIYVVVSALHGDEPNYNGDFFRWSELLRKNDGLDIHTWETWIGKPVCENHDIKAVRGMIVDAWPIKAEKSIDMLHRVDERINPNLVKGIRNGSIKGTSMGVMVTRSYCSVCNNLAYDESQWCLVPNTEILMDGHVNKFIQFVNIGDAVISHAGKPQKVLNKMVREVDEEICNIEISGEYRPLRITKNHEVLVIKKDEIHCVRDSKQSVCSAGNIGVCDKGPNSCKNPISDYFEVINYNFTPAGELEVGDWLLTPVVMEDTDFDKGINLDIVKLLGLYLAEGSIGAKAQSNKCVEFAINKNEIEITKLLIDASIKSLNGYIPRIHDRQNNQSRKVVISDGGYLASLCIKHCGENAKDKKLSKDILNLPKDLLAEFLKAYIEGDGYTPSKDKIDVDKISMETASKILADQLMYVCDKLGLHPYCQELENEPTELVPKEGLIIYRVEISKVGARKLYEGSKLNKNYMLGRYINYNGKLFRLRRINKIDYIKYQGLVYNLEVENDNSYVANNMIVHNCDHLSPRRLNIKGKRYTGQDGNLYPTKIGQICYENNLGLSGVEDSYITLGEPADPKALAKSVLASTNRLFNLANKE